MRLTQEQREQRIAQVERALAEINSGLTWDDIWFSDKERKIQRRWPEGTIIDAKAQTLSFPGKGWCTFDEWWEQKNQKS